ncbi:hypothetical protein [Polyangium aurulentum]|uniref:hypothetical protein n=1 Tax=Polyangium aurulentum TaxID=2567896 RepID=UPI0010AE97CC|nr:hypothetical protein [Polyangium aurulentum]UQA63067.1 hypothetical protein E8A73_022440 [Polyangium aurulentum]
MNGILKYTGLALTVTLVACGGTDEGPDGNANALLPQYRAAIPSEAQLMASSPKGSSNAKVGDPATFPAVSQNIVVIINGSVGHIINTMKGIVALEPDLYNSETKEFFWGPYPNEDGFGTVAAYIKDAGEGGDFRYHYALLRGVDKDVAKMKPVIWGGATPDPSNEEHGAGVTLWDFEANHAFEKDNNPDYANLKLDRGRFVAVYGAGAGDKGEGAFVVSVLRNFVPKDKPAEMPVNLDYFYGHFHDGTHTLDFLDWQSKFDIHNDGTKTAAESVGVHMAFLDEGTGRAEAQAKEGDLAANQVADIVECWDAAIAQTYVSLATSTGGVQDGQISEGDAASCGIFQKSLAELGVPSLEDVNAELMSKLEEVATNGAPVE